MISMGDDEEIIIRRPRIIRSNFFEEYDERDFFDRFRLFPRTVENVIEEIRDLIEHHSNR